MTLREIKRLNSIGPFTIAKTHFLENQGSPDPLVQIPPLNLRMFDFCYFGLTEMMEHTFIHEPTEVSFHDMSKHFEIVNYSAGQRATGRTIRALKRTK